MERILKKVILLIIIFVVLWYLGVFGKMIDFVKNSLKVSNVKTQELSDVEALKGVDKDIALGVVFVNINILDGRFEWDIVLKKALGLLVQNKAYVYTNILTLLKSADDPKVVLNHYISRLKKLLSETDAMLVMLSSYYSQYQSKSQNCRMLKLQGDKEFFDGVSLPNEGMALMGLSKSLDNADCYIKNRIKANAYKYINYKLSNYRNFLSQKLKFLETNTDLLSSNFSLFEGQYLEQLLQIKQQLKAFDLYSRQEFQTLWQNY